MEERTKEIVVITGASAGIGRAVAQEFGRNGARVALIARGKERLQQAKKEIEEMGGEAITFAIDVSDAGQLDATASLVEEKWGPIDVWVNNAMVTVLSPVKEMKPEEFRRVTEVTYLGQVYGAQAALKRMLPRNRGSIVFVGSALAYRGIPLQSAYCGAKHAIQGFYDSLRAELVHDNSQVKVSMVHLPAMNTPQFSWMRNRMPHKPRPMGTPYQPEEAGKAVYYAAHNEVREFKLGASSYIAIIGNKFFPGLGDWYLGKKGYQGQQTPEESTDGEVGNLFEPVEGNYSAHGRFDDEAKENSTTGWLGRNPKVPAAAALLLGALCAGAIFRR